MTILQQKFDIREERTNVEEVSSSMEDANDLVYLRARYYDPELGRFLNSDPIEGSIEQTQSLNRYSYGQNNPVNMADHSGLCASTDQGCLSAVQKLETDFPTAYIYWYKRSDQNKYGMFPTVTPGPTTCPTPLNTGTPGATPTADGITATPTLGPTPTSVSVQRIEPDNLLIWTQGDIDTIHQSLQIYQQARNLPMYNVPFVKVNFPLTQGGQTFYGNYGIHPQGASVYVGLGGYWATSHAVQDAQYRKWIVVHEMNHGLLYNNLQPTNYRSIGHQVTDAFVKPHPDQAGYPTLYAKENWSNDNPEYLVDSMTAMIWDATSQPSPQTSPEIYNTPVKNIISQDGMNTSLDQWIMKNIPGFLASQSTPTSTPYGH